MVQIKPLSEIIRWVDIRNKRLISENPLGINIDKCFMPSVANIIGTDLSNYKLITKNQFACNPMHVGRDEKIPIALYSDSTPSIVSPAYFVFEVKDSDLVNSDYLMLWFRRAEFDRECWFHTDGSVRGGITWEEIGEMTVPIPSIEEQNSIVKQYKDIERRISIKRQINDNLESQLQITFDKDLTHLLKTETLSNDYKLTSLSNMADYINGLAMQNYPAQNDENSLLVLKIRELRQGFCDEKSDKCTSDLAPQYIIHNGDIIFSWSGSLLVDIWTGGQVGLNQHLFNVVSNTYPKWFIYLWTKFHLENFIRIAEGKKTSMGHIKREDLDSAKVIVPNTHILCDMDKHYSAIFNELTVNKIEFNVLRKSQDLLLSTLSR